MQYNVKDFLDEYCQVSVFKAKSSTSYCAWPSLSKVYDKQHENS